MLNAIIRFSLTHRHLVAALSLLLVAFGAWQIPRLPIDVFPSLDRPRVVVMTEAPGLAPEEVESLITFPLETSLNGAAGVQAVRSSSGVGLSVIYVEFDWGTDIYNDRQVVAERIALVTERLPEGVVPQLAPISSVMGQIMIVGIWSEGGRTLPMELRTLADWVVRQRLLTIPGVSQVFVMGGERKQFQVLVDPARLLRYGVTLDEVRTALQESNQNATGGYLDEQGPHELLVRSLGRIHTIEELEEVVVKFRDGRAVLVGQLARVIEGPQVKRGDSAAFVRNRVQGSGFGVQESELAAFGSGIPPGAAGGLGPSTLDAQPSTPIPPLSTLHSPLSTPFAGGPAVLLTINKQPGADTRKVTDEVTAALEELAATLPRDIRIHPELYQQKAFIDLAIENVAAALRDGSILVVVILFVFLLNFRTTFITLTAIPVSIVITALVFRWLGLSINTMTLGGLAVAIGELVDDAIVDVENIFRRLRENRFRPDPKPPLWVVYRASVEVRNSIVFGTLIVVLAFLPVFGLSGMEGRLFTPLGIAYIISILSSLLVSLTLTPVLSYWLLPKARITARAAEGWLLWGMKRLAAWSIGLSLRAPMPVLAAAAAAVALAAYGLVRLENDFLPPFNEGTVQLNVILPPGTSLAKSCEVAEDVERRLQQVPDLDAFVRKTGRAELDEHAVTVNFTEFIASFNPHSLRSRAEILEDLRHAMEGVPAVIAVDQPLQHLISHMLSGVQAQVAIKLYGDDLDVLRRTARQMQAAVAGVEGVEDLYIEPQVDIPQLRIEVDGHKLQRYGLRRADVNKFVETAMQGEVVSEVLDGQRSFDLVVRLDEEFRENLDEVKRLSIALPDGGTTMLESVARVYVAGGPNAVKREQARRRIVLQCNTAGRGLVDVVGDIRQRLRPIEQSLPRGYAIEYGGQFESQQSASRVIAVLLAVSLLGMFLVLYTMFRSANLSLQVMIALPAAFVGAVAALWLTRQTLTVAAMVGFISLSGIASRNGILLINHYLHLVRHENEKWSRGMIIRAGTERVAPVLMTALTSGIGLVPLAMAAGEPGKEILYPVATVIIGGLVTSTLAEFFVRPALFARFGLRAGRHLVRQGQEEIALGAGLDAAPGRQLAAVD